MLIDYLLLGLFFSYVYHWLTLASLCTIKWGTISPFTYPSISSPFFSSIPFPFPLPPLHLPPFVFFPLLSFPFPFTFTSPQIQLGLGELKTTPVLAEVVITPPPPVILWQVVSQSFSFFKSTSSRQSVISHFFTWLTPGTSLTFNLLTETLIITFKK